MTVASPSTFVATTIRIAAVLVCAAAAQQAVASENEAFLLGPPRQDGPAVVRAFFHLHDVNDIDDEAETFEINGVLTLEWRDPRQVFDAVVAGVDEKVFQGSYQFDELATGWYPQVVLVNESGMYETSGVVLRVRPDGTSTLIATVNAVAEADFDMRLFPFDEQRLEAVFEVLGFDRDEVLLRVDADSARIPVDEVRIPQWAITQAAIYVRDHSAGCAGHPSISSALVLSIDVQRQSWYVRRLVVLPLIVIVLLSFSVFWMDRASLGDRLSVSFIGILTAVAYQMMISDHLPPIAYRTLIHSFLGWSFLTMCTTVVVSLVVRGLDQRGKVALGDLVDRRCRWAFPLAYFGVNVLIVTVEFFR